MVFNTVFRSTFPVSNNHLRLHFKDFLWFSWIFKDIKIFCSCYDWTSGFCAASIKTFPRDIGKYLWVFIEHLKKVNIKKEFLWWWKWWEHEWHYCFVLYHFFFHYALHVTFLMALTLFRCSQTKHNGKRDFTRS